MAVPYTFGSATTSIPLSQLDSNFATTITLGNTSIQLGNTVTTLNNMTMANVTVSSASTPVPEAAGGTGTTTGYYGFKNRIINGAMVIDQRNAGASVTNVAGSVYTLDRWQAAGDQASKFTVQQNAGSVTPPVGFANYLGVTSLSSYSVPTGEGYNIRTKIEGFNIADLAWGTASAKTVTLSFQVYSSLTGTFGGALANNGSSRTYPFSYTISSANTWTTISVTVAGDTSGTWLTTNGIGLEIRFGLGVGASQSGTAGSWSSSNYYSSTGAVSVVGTSGATWYITGVQLEKGSTATSFDYRPIGTELALCQRYYETSYPLGSAVGTSNNTMYWIAGADGAGSCGPNLFFKVSKRATPSFNAYTDTGTSGLWNYGRSGSSGTVSVNSSLVGTNGGLAYAVLGTTWSVIYLYGNWTASAEL